MKTTKVLFDLFTIYVVLLIFPTVIDSKTLQRKDLVMCFMDNNDKQNKTKQLPLLSQPGCQKPGIEKQVLAAREKQNPDGAETGRKKGLSKAMRGCPHRHGARSRWVHPPEGPLRPAMKLALSARELLVIIIAYDRMSS